MRFKPCLSAVVLASLLSLAVSGCAGIADAIDQQVYVDPPAPVVGVSETQNLSTYLLEGGTPDDYSWTVREGTAGGTLSVSVDVSTGLHSRAVYTAPSAIGTYHIDVTTNVDGVSKKGTSTITVQ